MAAAPGRKRKRRSTKRKVGSTYKRARDVISGEFTDLADAAARGANTVVETIKRKLK